MYKKEVIGYSIYLVGCVLVWVNFDFMQALSLFLLMLGILVFIND